MNKYRKNTILQKTVLLTSRATRQLFRLPRRVQELAAVALDDLSREGIRPERWLVKKTGDHEFRLRLNRSYRMRYRSLNKRIEIIVFYIGHRKHAYRKTK